MGLVPTVVIVRLVGEAIQGGPVISIRYIPVILILQ